MSSQLRCHICGVSFNIGRVRRPDEPPAAAWDGFSTGYVLSYPAQFPGGGCPKSAQCMSVFRIPFASAEDLNGKHGFQEDMDDIEDDGDYVPDCPENDEPFELYKIPQISSANGSVSDGLQRGEPEVSSNLRRSSNEAYRRFLHLLEHPAEDFKMRPHHLDLSLATDLNSANEPLDTVPYFQTEHIAGGSDCRINCLGLEGGGYNGHNISFEDMRWCKTAQFLVRKPDQWCAAPDDDEFERSGHYFLSGLSDSVPHCDFKSEVFPRRHDVSSPNGQNVIGTLEDGQDYAMPFHPACLEVFKRASLYRYGQIDIEGLADWWFLEATQQSFYDFPRHSAVQKGKHWHHTDGDEFLAANPCFITQLPNVLAAAERLGNEIVDTSTSSKSEYTRLRCTDVFSVLPPELRSLILIHLTSPDVANLRLASRTFYQIPQYIFRSLTLREMPWLWEAWSTLDYSFWASTTGDVLEAKIKQHRQRLEKLQAAVEVLIQEGNHGNDQRNINEAAISTVQSLIESMEEEGASIKESVPAPFLLANKTNWYRLRCELARNSTSILGLRNRRRIWKDCEEILDRIERYRAEGKIMAG
ncbi:hypothetical protein JX266_011214 [Neoarthrinium moseri]|nr:hypothetical protein JX266_011214 [Neoarthrinium moseri]